MSAQDKTEQILRDIHILFSKSEIYDRETSRIIVNKDEFLDLLKNLNLSIYEMMEERGLSEQCRDASERESRKKSDKIIADAGRMAEDVYAGSVLYTDEALRRVQDIMQSAMDSVQEICQKMGADLAAEKHSVQRDQTELRSHLEDLKDTDKYLELIKERNKEIAREKEKADEEPPVFASVKPEIKINAEYFEKAGIAMVENLADEMPEEESENVPPEVKVNLDAEYFRWKEDGEEPEKEVKKSGRHSLFGKILKGEN